MTSPSSKMVENYFDTVASNYAREIVQSKIGENAIKLINIGQKDLVLDIGSGSGRLYKAARAVDAEAVAIDISRRMIEELKASFPDADCIRGHAQWLPIRNSSFGKVVSNEVWIQLFSFENQEAFLTEISRILTGGGKVVVGGVRNASPFKPFMPSILIPCLRQIIHMIERRQLRNIIPEIRRLLWSRIESVGFLKIVTVPVYNFTVKEIYAHFANAHLSIRRMVGRSDAPRVPIISRFASPLLGYSLVDIVASKA